MSKTLNLVGRLLANARHYQELGRNSEALRLFERLAGFGALDPAVVEESHVRLAEIRLRRGQPRRARRHLAAVLTSRPESARYHYLMAAALVADEKADPRRAVKHFQKSLELDANQPTCLCEYGTLALRLGQPRRALKALRQAVSLAPDDPAVIHQLATGLTQLGRPDEARLVLRAALFRNPRDGRFRKLWSDFQFHRVREQQELAQARQQGLAEGAGPRLLPFVCPDPPPGGLGRKRFRLDRASSPNPPRFCRPAPGSGRKHA
jgi:Flp pilus assembly protein TadD